MSRIRTIGLLFIVIGIAFLSFLLIAVSKDYGELFWNNWSLANPPEIFSLPYVALVFSRFSIYTTVPLIIIGIRVLQKNLNKKDFAELTLKVFNRYLLILLLISVVIGNIFGYKQYVSEKGLFIFVDDFQIFIGYLITFISKDKKTKEKIEE